MAGCLAACARVADGPEVVAGDPANAAAPTDLDGRPLDPLRVVDAKAHVLIFVLPDCPIANTYAPEIQALDRDYGPRGVRFFLVHVDPDVTRARARRHAEEYGHRPTILLDPSQTLVAATGATISPEAAVLDADGRLIYRGRIDNRYGDLGRKRPRATRHELRDALDALLTDRPVKTARTEAIGCFIPDP